MQKRKIPLDKVPTSKNYLKKPEISEYLEKKKKKGSEEKWKVRKGG